eukprot:Tbor_TRINITY_DN3830_c0_g1::TRINITY_DN3830_c0_g1_i1::g.5581::m.5581/K15100/SLC25A1, CTP; solute carrier family 25 (mitochondrial citrate transporter), member 1
MSSQTPSSNIEVGNEERNVLLLSNSSQLPIQEKRYINDKKTASGRYETIKPILAGGITGAIECIVTYPTEYVKTSLQLQTKIPKGNTKVTTTSNISAAEMGGSHQQQHYNGIIDCYVKTVKRNGFLGLYSGMGPVLFGSIPKQGVRWGTYEGCASAVCSFKQSALFMDDHLCKKDQLSLAEVSACGLIAGCTEALVAVVPIETIKTRLIEDSRRTDGKSKYSGMGLFRAVSCMVKTDGIYGIYKGVGNTVMKQSVNQSVRFPVQQATMSILCNIVIGHPPSPPTSSLSTGSCNVDSNNSNNTSPQSLGGTSMCIEQPSSVHAYTSKHPSPSSITIEKTYQTKVKSFRKSPFWNGVAGFTAGIVSVLLSQPFDVVKTRMQGSTSVHYSSSMQCWASIAKQEGIMTFYSGVVPRMMRVGCNVALTFTLFPLVRQLL